MSRHVAGGVDTRAFAGAIGKRTVKKKVLPAPTGYYGYRDGPFSWADLVPSGDGLRMSYVALREMAAGLMYRLVDRQ